MSFSELRATFPSSATSRRRVLVVDDSAFMRRLVSDVVQSSGEFEVVGTARDGHDALRQVQALDPDLVTLDVDMPGLDGLSALTQIMREAPRPVVMLSAGTTHGGMDATLRALEAGAVDFVRKPSGAISLDLDLVRDQLLQALRAAAHAQWNPAQVDGRACTVNALTASAHRAALHAAPSTSAAAASGHAPRLVVAIAASTGGPAALARVIPQLPNWSDVAVVVVQHMPVGFTASFAQRLGAASRLRVAEAVADEPLRAGHVYIAPGGWHLRVRGPREQPRVALHDDAPLWGVRPAADHLFASVAEVYGPGAVGVVMTGMGRDGAQGLATMHEAGARVMVQDAATCIIPGMPEAARRAVGLAGGVPLADLAEAIVQTVDAAKIQRSTPHEGDA
jgi:two-component system, chemotaxis family, protein-glutamate methylesterase/glutaminase